MKNKLAVLALLMLFIANMSFAQTPVSPANTLTGVSIQPAFTWTNVNHTDLFDIAIVSGSASGLVSGYTVINASLVTPTGSGPYTYSLILSEAQKLSNNTVYYWNIIPHSTTPDAHTGAFSFQTTPSLSITSSYPTNGTTGVDFNNVQFSFASGTYSSSYKYTIQYIIDPGHSPIVLSDWASASTISVTDMSSLPVSPSSVLSAITKYYWRVVVLTSHNEVVNYSGNFYFTTKRGSYKPMLSWPVGQVPVYTNTPTLYWYIGTYDLTGLTFTVNIYSDAGLTTHVAGDGFIATDISVDVPGTCVLTSGQAYYWTVTCTYGSDSQTSSKGSFLVKGTGTVTKPYLSYPVNDVSIYTLLPTLYWYLTASGDGLYYDVYIYDATGATIASPTSLPIGSFTKIGYNLTDLYLDFSSGLYTAFPLSASKTYQWCVVAKNQNTTNPSNYLISTSSTFKVDPSLGSGSPVASWPKGNPTLQTTTPTVYWYLSGQQTGFDNYKVKWNATTNPGSDGVWDGVGGGTTSSAITDLTQMNYTFTSPLAAGHWYWAVAAFTGGTRNTNSSWSVGDFTVSSSISSNGVVISAPTGGTTIYTTYATFYWYVTGAGTSIDHYVVTYSRASDSTVTGSDTYGLIKQAVLATDVNVSVTGLIPGATYYWRIDAHNASHGIVASATNGRFIVAPTASSSVVPIAGSPINSIQINNSAATLSWFTPTPSQSQLKYNLEYAANNAFNNSTLVKDIQGQTYNLTGLSKNQTYYWRVSSQTDAGIASGVSNTGIFKTSDGVTAVETQSTLPTQYELKQNYPNPFNPTTVINFALPKNSYVTLRVYDMLGREVKTLVDREMSAGVHTLNWNADNNLGQKVTSGVYIYRITAGDFRATRKMVLIK